jgi:cytochrome c biogenesis protein
LIFGKYRFYTTFNKGFSPVLTWLTEQGEPQTGTINMPSYPLFEYKQDNLWTPPGGKEIKFWLQLSTGMDLYSAWTLDGRNSSGVLVVTSDGKRQEVNVGESVALPGGKLRFDALTTWMGYRVFYDPTIQWMFFVSVFGVLGLMHYFWVKMNLQPWERQEETGVVPEAVKDKTNMTATRDKRDSAETGSETLGQQA